ncbi:hypothetical protein DPMN_035099 [Dreissena polymorpha]|uniref:Uncharacterized protein n=1 Tax=Dreissena polymorpha TaxID=45954 RepID=A0A9D4M9X1_DREPO|nr:hypothetical protein DPMN_035099 [Dreissena polymorpha]
MASRNTKNSLASIRFPRQKRWRAFCHKQLCRSSLIRLLGAVGDLFLHPRVSQKCPPYGLKVNAVERLLIVDEVDIQRRIPLQRFFQNDAHGCVLTRSRSLLPDAGLLFTKIRIYCIFHSLQQDAIKHFSSVTPQQMLQELKLPFLRSLMKYHSFHYFWYFFFSQYLVE